ncbi:ABC transporter ATP-binding protein [Natronospira sp.]|uniref:ABC transporter ATP-binding protein n=1 Tax=Natronospira sp. TaxID=2024970 RepID=UPI0038732AEA
MSSDLLVECRGLGRDYGQHKAVDNVDFSLERGQVLAFLGPNGAGKSTTMNMLTGCLAPSRGEVRICGIDLLEQPAAAKARLGYLPEHPPLYPELTVDEYLRFTARLRGLPRKALGGAVARAKQRCGLTREAGKLIGRLSRGYQQRVGIAQAIIHEPDLVILDEPTVGLDPNQVREIRELVGELASDHGIILSTHILPEVTATCSHVQIMVGGRLVHAGSLAELEHRPVTGLRVGFVHAVDPQALWELPGVESVEKRGDNEVFIRHKGREDLAPACAELAIKRQWGLRFLEPERTSLEQLFVNLTSGEQEAAA